MMASITSAFKHALASVEETKKVSKLQSNVVTPSHDSRLTTDAGVKITNTDNWYVSSTNHNLRWLHSPARI
jgi:hypothetical protein